jgi:hypothetical protein
VSLCMMHVCALFSVLSVVCVLKRRLAAVPVAANAVVQWVLWMAGLMPCNQMMQAGRQVCSVHVAGCGGYAAGFGPCHKHTLTHRTLC